MWILHTEQWILLIFFLAGFIKDKGGKWLGRVSLLLSLYVHVYVMYGFQQENILEAEYLNGERYSDHKLNNSSFWSFTWEKLIYIFKCDHLLK